MILMCKFTKEVFIFVVKRMSPLFLGALLLGVFLVVMQGGSPPALATHVSSDWYQTNLGHHPAGSGEDYYSRLSITYYDHNTTDVEFGNLYHYVDAVDDCVRSMSAYVSYGNNQEFPAFNGEDIDPGQCDPDTATYTWDTFSGNTYAHGTNDGVILQGLVYTDDDGGGLQFSWEILFHDNETITDLCMSC